MKKFKLLVAFSREASTILEESEKKTFQEKLQELKDHSDSNFVREDYDFQVREFDSQEAMDAYVQGVNDANGWLDSAMFEFA